MSVEAGIKRDNIASSIRRPAALPFSSIGGPHWRTRSQRGARAKTILQSISDTLHGVEIDAGLPGFPQTLVDGFA